jgi:hypothetical protein
MTILDFPIPYLFIVDDTFARPLKQSGHPGNPDEIRLPALDLTEDRMRGARLERWRELCE